MVIGITAEKDRAKLIEFARHHKLSYPILLDGGKTFKDYKLGQIPDVCFINKKLAISSIYLGYNPGGAEKIAAEIGKLLAIVPE